MTQNGTGALWWKAPAVTVTLALVTYIVLAILNFDRTVVAVRNHEGRICKIEGIVLNQPMRDYILVELARKNGISIPRELQ